jgi:hypothetical protein
MAFRINSTTVAITDIATPGEIVYTAPKTTMEVIVNVYATNIDGAANRTITVQHEKGGAHAAQELLNIVDAYPVVFKAKQELVCTMRLKGHKTDPDEVKIWGEVASEIVVLLTIEEDRLGKFW